MKKVLIISVAIVCIIFLSISYYSVKTPEEALALWNVDAKKIVHIEYVKKGAFVFYQHTKDSISCSYFKKGILGWKSEHDMVQGGMEPFYRDAGMSYTTFFQVKSMPYTLYFGIIKDPLIQEVKVNYNNGTEVSESKIIENNKIRLWLAPVGQTQDRNATITSYSIEGKEVSQMKLTDRDIRFEFYNRTP